MARQVCLAVLVCAAVLLVAVRGCEVSPGGCSKAVCDSYAGLTMVNSSWDYSRDNTWRRPAASKLGIYLGVDNNLFVFRPIIRGNAPGGFDRWLSRRGKGLPSLNYERFDAEVDFNNGVLGADLTVQECCNACREKEGCALFQLIPSDYTAGAPARGRCISKKGGTVKSDGPFDIKTKENLGTPFAGSNSQQASQARRGIRPTFVGGSCNPLPGVKDDPHFVGAHGTNFDFTGELGKSFCLVTDTRLHINALLKGYEAQAAGPEKEKAIRSWIHEVGIMWEGGQSLRLVAREGKQQERGSGFLASATLDGKPMEVPPEEGQSTTAGQLTFTNLGVSRVGPYDVERFQVKVGDLVDLILSMRPAHKLLQTPEDAQVHFNVLLNSIKTTEKVHGVLGQTYRNTESQLLKAVKYSELSRLMGQPVKADGESGKGFLDGQIQDYESSDVTKADCKVSTFVQ